MRGKGTRHLVQLGGGVSTCPSEIIQDSGGDSININTSNPMVLKLSINITSLISQIVWLSKGLWNLSL